MEIKKRLDTLYRQAERLPFTDSDKLVLMSDVHRGDAGHSDDFAHNQTTYFHALTQYEKQGFTYIELGDGDELWENRSPRAIQRAHSGIFWLLARFYADGRLWMLHGNHDMVKRDAAYAQKRYSHYYDDRLHRELPLFPGIRFPESLVLRHQPSGNEMLLIHGHQGDWISDGGWMLGRFLVRYLWRPLQLIGINDPTLPAKNHRRREPVERNFTQWALARATTLIAGHTHRPALPAPGQPPYINDGCCVHPRCITAIEIQRGGIALVKWHVNARDNGDLFIDREALAGPIRLSEWFSALIPSQAGAPTAG